MKKRLLLSCIVIILLCVSVDLYSQDRILQLKEQILDIQNKGELGFHNFTLCSNILGYGQYVPIPDKKAKVGTTVYFYYEPVNLFTNRLNNSYQIWYTQDLILLRKDGKELYNAPELLNFNYQTTSPVLDVYASNSLELGELAPGYYIFKAVMHDKLKKTDATYSLTFEIVE